MVRHQFRLALRPGRAAPSLPSTCHIDAIVARDAGAAETAAPRPPGQRDRRDAGEEMPVGPASV